jgi:hypothetical protein
MWSLLMLGAEILASFAQAMILRASMLSVLPGTEMTPSMWAMIALSFLLLVQMAALVLFFAKGESNGFQTYANATAEKITFR